MPLGLCLDHRRYEYSMYLLLITSEIIVWIVKLLEDAAFSTNGGVVLFFLADYGSKQHEGAYSMQTSIFFFKM